MATYHRGFRRVLLRGACLLALLGRAQPASAQNAADLSAARRNYDEALRDIEAHRYEAACAKLVLVRQVKDTPTVRYWSGECEEGQGRLATALAIYREAIALAENQPKFRATLDAATKRASDVEREVPHLRLELPPSVTELRIQIDDVTRTAQAPVEPIPLNPGPHSIAIDGDEIEPAHMVASLTRGADVVLKISIRAKVEPPRQPAPFIASAPPPPVSKPALQVVPPPAPSRLPWTLTVAGGGVLLASAAALLVSQRLDLAAMDRRCPGGTCATPGDLASYQTIRDRQAVEGPLGVVLGALGVGAVGLGAYMLARPSAPLRSGTLAPTVYPVVSATGAGGVLSGAF